jgi:chemotaxis protein methyltransferase CheR
LSLPARKPNGMHFDAFLKRACPPLNLEWRKYRRRAARHRVLARMEELGLSRFEDYLERLAGDAREAARLPELMRITVSRFFREAALWQALRQEILPHLLASSSFGRPLNVWSVGCAGGEEPYTMALLWDVFLQARYPHRKITILAEDIDRASLERAGRAIYHYSSLKEVPETIFEKGFSRKNDHWQLQPRLRAMVRFRRHNFMVGPPPGFFDLVLARYLPFTYYRGERRLQAARRLWRALRPGGVLMIGAKEVLGIRERELFVPWPGAEGFFRRDWV